jgi:hypothetical protein
MHHDPLENPYLARDIETGHMPRMYRRRRRVGNGVTPDPVDIRLNRSDLLSA